VALPASFEVPTHGLPDGHVYELVAADGAGLQRRFGVTFESMGRGYDEDPVFFDAAVAAVKLALRGASG
jgi:hypothetical protein